MKSRLFDRISDLTYGFDVYNSHDEYDSRVLTPKQVHGSDVVIVDRIQARIPADGLVTNTKGLCIGVVTADCVPVLLVDPVAQVVGAVHAGWRGTAAVIVSHAVYAMTRLGAVPHQMYTIFGPSIGLCCFEVGDDVAEQFYAGGAGCVEKLNGRSHVNLTRVNYQQLVSAGVPESNIEAPVYCTSCQSDRFPSYRRDKTDTRRIVSWITLLKA